MVDIFWIIYLFTERTTDNQSAPELVWTISTKFNILFLKSNLLFTYLCNFLFCSVTVYSSWIQLPCPPVPGGRGCILPYPLPLMENTAMELLYLWNVISCCVACWHLSPWALFHSEASCSRRKHNLPPDITNPVILLFNNSTVFSEKKGAFSWCLGNLKEMNNAFTVWHFSLCRWL